MNFLGGNWDISFDPITGQANIQVTGAGVAKLEDVGDVPAYLNDGKVNKLNEENGVLTWEEDAGEMVHSSHYQEQKWEVLLRGILS